MKVTGKNKVDQKYKLMLMAESSTRFFNVITNVHVNINCTFIQKVALCVLWEYIANNGVRIDFKETGKNIGPPFIKSPLC